LPHSEQQAPAVMKEQQCSSQQATLLSDGQAWLAGSAALPRLRQQVLQ
jgi:hypothetical protein